MRLDLSFILTEPISWKNLLGGDPISCSNEQILGIRFEHQTLADTTQIEVLQLILLEIVT